MQDIRYDGRYEYIVDKVGFVSVERNKDYTFEFKNGKERHSFIFVEKGQLEYKFDGCKEPFIIEKGSVMFVPKNIPYKTSYINDNTKIAILLFDTDHTPDHLKQPSAKSGDNVQSVFNKISLSQMSDTLYLTSKIYELLYIWQKETAKIPKKYIGIIPAVDEIKQSFSQNHNISFYAGLCNMSESNFRKLFKEFIGMSPIEYRNSIRIFEAKRMIDSGFFTVSEAAYTVGFNNMSFFYEVYNKYRK